MKVYSREHHALVQYENAATNYRPTVADLESPNLLQAFDSFTEGVGKFILSELNYRQGERSQILGVYPNRTDYYSGIGGEFNAAGIAALDEGKAFLEQFVNALPNGGGNYQALPESVAEFRSAFQKIIIDVEAKAGDIAELNGEFEEIATLTLGNNPREVGNYLLNRYNQLTELRATPGRGAETNLPLWKLYAAAVIIGVGFVLIGSCYYGLFTCTRARRRQYEAAILIAAIVLGAC
jgi:hypothetical protein